MANNIRREARVAPVKPSKTDAPANRVTPKKPATAERRIAPNSNVALPSIITPTPVIKRKAEKRAAAAPTAPTAPIAPSRSASVGVSKGVLNRKYSLVHMMDEIGPELTELSIELMKDSFGVELDGATTRLVVLDKGISRTITGTGDPALDGTRFSFSEAEPVLVSFHKDGSMTLYNIKTTDPVSAMFDSRAARSLKFTIVPTDPDEFQRFIISTAKVVEAHGLRLEWAV